MKLATHTQEVVLPGVFDDTVVDTADFWETPDSDSAANLGPEVDAFYARLTRQARVRMALVMGLLAFLVLGSGLWHRLKPSFRKWRRGEITLSGAPRYEPRHPVDPERLARTDLRRIHTDLFPGWAMARARGDAEVDRSARQLNDALADRNLAALAGELHRAAAGDLRQNAERIFYLTWAWNRYLSRNNEPWFVDANIRTRPRNILYFKTYSVVSDTWASEGSRRLRARLALRTDGTNLVEQYLGWTGKHLEGAMVIVDRAYEFAQDRVWPLLDEGLLPERPLDQRFAAAIRREANHGLSGQAMTVLRRTASARARLLRAVASINNRSRCGRGYRVNYVGHRGFDAAQLRRLFERATNDLGQLCPRVTLNEATTALLASVRLTGEPELALAVGALTAWFSRGVAVHELRHAADDMVSSHAEPPACDDCPGYLGRRGRAEFSAYLASFATPGSGFVHLFQTCITAERAPFSAAGMAVEAATETLQASCDSKPPAELYRRARQAEQELFGHQHPIQLSANYPKVVPLPNW